MRRSERDEAAVLLRLPRRVQLCASRFLCAPSKGPWFQYTANASTAEAHRCSRQLTNARRMTGMHRLQHPGCLKTPKQGLHSGVCTTRSATQSALLRLLQFTVRADCSQFCFLLHSMRFQCPACRSRPTANILQTSSLPLQANSRQFCRRKSSRAAMLWTRFLFSWTCSARDTLSQFLTDHAAKFVVLRHEHGRPVSRSESDLQGPNLGGRVPRQRIRTANPHLPSVPLGTAILSRRMPVTKIEQKLRRIRRSAWKQEERTSHDTLRNR